MPSFAASLRSAFAFVGLFVAALWFGSTAFAAAPSHAHRYPDAVVAKLWTPTGERWVRLEQSAPGLYQGSVEFASDGWMAVTEYYDFTCLLTLDDPTAPLKFHHEFRSADGFDADPSELWASLTFNWATGAFEQTEDFAAVFDDPAEVASPPSGQTSAVSPGSPKTSPSRSTQAAAPTAPGASGPSAPTYDADGFDAYGFDRSGYDRDGYDANGYDRRGVDRQGINRDGVYQGDFDAEGYDSTGYDRDGYDREGYDHNGRDREGYDYEGFNAAGYSRYGVISMATTKPTRRRMPTVPLLTTSVASMLPGVTATARSSMTTVTTGKDTIGMASMSKGSTEPVNTALRPPPKSRCRGTMPVASIPPA